MIFQTHKLKLNLSNIDIPSDEVLLDVDILGPNTFRRILNQIGGSQIFNINSNWKTDWNLHNVQKLRRKIQWLSHILLSSTFQGIRNLLMKIILPLMHLVTLLSTPTQLETCGLKCLMRFDNDQITDLYSSWWNAVYNNWKRSMVVISYWNPQRILEFPVGLPWSITFFTNHENNTFNGLKPQATLSMTTELKRRGLK
jgi:hypothetical protein